MLEQPIIQYFGMLLYFYALILVFNQTAFRGDTASIKDVSLDVAVSKDTAEMSENVAFGVEMCDCPQEYSGSSCQDPAEGYCRHRAPDYLNSEDDIALIGLPTPCACNGHSTTCDPETCQCTVRKFQN